MYKKLLYGIAAITALFHSIGANAQTRLLPNPYENSKGNIPCGATHEYFKAHEKDTSTTLGTGIIIPISFPPAAIDTCGKFRVFYEDKALATNDGFHAPSGIGDNRRAILCQVLNDIQSIFDFSSIPSGQYIRLHIDTSYGPSYLSAPSGTDFYARAAPYSPALSGISDGYLNKFVRDGIDPVSLTDEYHANLHVNFHKVFLRDDSGKLSTKTISLDYYESLSTSIGDCQIDLYSVLLHEITHTLGWLSRVKISGTSLGTSLYSSIDTSVHVVNFASSNPFSTIQKAILSGSLSVSYPKKGFWLNNKMPPYNHSVFGADEYRHFGYVYSQGNFSHLNDARTAYLNAIRLSPGDYQNYVMNVFGKEGWLHRSYTKGEIEGLHEILGYTYTSSTSSSFIVTNHTPYSTKMTSTAYNNAFVGAWFNYSIAEIIPSDTTIKNDSSVVFTYSLANDTTLHDKDGDTIRVFPNSLINFRGCGNGGNNHSLLTVSSDGRSISFTPRPQFYGKAQFGFNLWDGKEKGAFVFVTVDVQKGNKVFASAGDNLVVNGNFEEGSEIKIRGTDEGIDNSALIANCYVGRLGGAYFSDGHPNDLLTNLYFPFGGGTIIQSSEAECDSTSVVHYSFGSWSSTFPKNYPLIGGAIAGVGYPNSATGGNRYQAFLKDSISGYYYLRQPLNKCSRYILEFDALATMASLLAKLPTTTFSIGFTNSIKADIGRAINSDSTDRPVNFKLSKDFDTVLNNTWTHIRIPFNYCSDSLSDILTLKFFNSTNYLDYKTVIDNISIKADTSTPTLALIDSTKAPCHNTKLTARISNFNKYHCAGYGDPKVYWIAAGDTISRDSIIYVAPKITTTYKVVVTDGCALLSDTVVVAGSTGLVVTASDLTVCYGDSIRIDYLVTDSTGPVSYSWTPTTGLSCSSCAHPYAKVLTTTKYTLTVSDSVSCFKQDIVVNVRPKLKWDISNDTTICLGREATLIANTGLNSHTWSPSSSLTCSTCDTTYASPTSTTDYILSITDIYGCKDYDTLRVTINPLPVTSITATPPTACGGAPVSLTASGGIVYSWQYSPYLTCIPCSTTMVTPPIDETFTVAVTDINGCMALDSILVKARSKPLVHAIAPAEICQFTAATVVGMGAKTYTWATLAGTTTGIACPTCPATTITLSTPTSYVVTGTDSNGCTGKDTFFIDINPLPTIGVTTPIINACANDTVNLTATGGISYVWSPSAGVSCTTCNPTKAKAPSSPYTYIVTGTDTNGCKNTATATITTGVCPCTPASVFGTSASTLSGTIPTTISSGYYYLPNNITISSNTVMTGAKILIERGVTITVDTNAKLTLDNCHLFTCDEDTSKAMWRGIVLASTGAGAGGSSGRIEVRNNCLIEDAMFAIDAINLKTPSSGDVINVSNSTFNRNQVDISMNGYKVGSPAVLPISIKSNLFTARKFTRATMIGYPNTWISTATLKAKTTVSDSKPPYAIVKTYPSFTKMKCKDTSIFSVLAMRTTEMGQTSITGVYQSEVKIGEGGAVDDYNLIDNHQYGFLSYNSNVTLLHNHFINISRLMNPIPYSPTAAVGNGMAVLLQSSKTSDNRANVIMSAGGNLINKFHDCFMGIYTENIATLSIQNTEITKSDTAGGVVAGAAFTSETYSGYGMMLHCEGIQKSTNISSNTLSNVNVGIQFAMVNPKSGHTATMLNNSLSGINTDTAYSRFIAKQCMSRGIDVYSSGGVLGTANSMTIKDNTISKVFNGISFQGLQNIKCSTTNNTITLWDTSIASVTALPLTQYGIQCNSTNEATISGNSISTPTLNPVVILGDRIKGVKAGFNTSLRICGNTTTNIGRGFEFASGADQTGTRWIDNTMTNGYKGMVLASNIGDQGFMYNWVTMPWTYWGATLNKWTGTWSSGISKNQTVGVDYINTMLSKLWVKDDTIGTSERPTENSNTFLLPFPNRYGFLGTSRSIRISQQEANCLGSILPTKFNPIPKGGLTGVKTLGLLIMADSLGYDATYNVRQWMSQLSLYELGTIDPELRDSSAALDSFMNEAASSRFAWLTNIEKAINSDDFSTAQNLLDNPVSAMGRVVVNGDLIITDYIEADEVVENYTNYYSAYLQFLQGTMTDSDSARIRSIAHKCPVKDGAVVYKARALQQRLSFDFIVYNDDSCEYNNGSNYRIAPDATITGGEGNNAYTLYPNPNNGSFVIKQSIAENKAVNLKVYNAIGSLVYQSEATFVNGQMNVKLGQKAQGVYLVCIGDNKERNTCLRFIIN